MKQQQKKSIQLWVRKRIISMCFKNVSRAFDDLHGLLFLQRKNYYGVVPWKPDGILNLLKKSLYGILLLLLWKKKFVLDIPDLAFSSDLFFERNQLEDKEEEFFLKRKQRVFVCFVTDHCWNNANASFFSSKWSMMTTMVTSQMILKKRECRKQKRFFYQRHF